jgi:hypothetical protein
MADAPDEAGERPAQHLPGDGPVPGTAIIRASWASTVALAVTAAVSVAVESLQWVIVPVAVALAVVGFVTFAAAYLTAIGRSRTDEIAVAGVFFLIGCAPRSVQRSLLGSFGVQIVVALVAAGLRPYTSVAFAILAPLCGLGLAGLWGARHGVFPPRRDRRADRVPRRR